ncbi:ROK family transcriptional regulator [Bellilinea sp.]|uniref:ROK family transcriptional regulator n=1 Tax=Bellilinea sp. TaxID=2838785 RepID=UPI002ADD47F1|nr:ROK family transcriptional regulator [Bellilinea sp.]
MRRLDTTIWQVPKANVKNLNKHATLDLIRFSPSGISRIELSRELGLTRAAVTAIVGDLIKAGLVRETNGQFSRGRRAIALEINPQGGLVVGVDIGATHVTLVLADYLAHVMDEVEASLDIFQGPQVCLPFVDQFLRSWLDELGVNLAQITAIGVGVPGPIVTDAGMVSGPPIMPGWDLFPIREWLEKAWGCPVTLGNDAEFGALGEWAFGAGRGVDNLVYIKVGTGIGAGLLIDGQIYRGTTGCAGEIGHVTIEENGPLCTCGNRGCLEALAGGRAIAQKAIFAIKAGARTTLSELPSVEAISAMDVIAAARKGDHLSQKLVQEAGYYLGTALANLINLFNPTKIVIGGGVAQVGDLLLDPVRKVAKQRSLKVASQAVTITSAVLGKRSSAMGAVAQAISLSLHQLAEAS